MKKKVMVTKHEKPNLIFSKFNLKSKEGVAFLQILT